MLPESQKRANVHMKTDELSCRLAIGAQMSRDTPAVPTVG